MITKDSTQELCEYYIRGLPRPLSLVANGIEFEILYDAVLHAAQLEGLSAEIGVREGGSSEIILHGLSEGVKFPHICIDPYGDLPYSYSDGEEPVAFDYGTPMKQAAQRDLTSVAAKLGVDVIFMPFEDTEFFRRFPDGVPTYEAGKKAILSKYRLVFIDGPHVVDAVMREAEFFVSRMQTYGFMVFDDTQAYDHQKVHNYLMDKGFKVHLSGSVKTSYMKLPEE